MTFEVVTRWKNGTETTGTLTENIETGLSMMVIGANLKQGDTVRPEFNWTSIIGFPLVWPERKLNQSITVPFNGITREVNVLDWLLPSPFGPPTTRAVYWWDKQTGIQVRYWINENGTDFMSGQSYRYIAVLELVDTSKGWGAVIPENMNFEVALIGSAVAFILGKRFNRKQLSLKSP
ncbi:MAG: hypothetical protein QW056_02380 [Candidatus Bathyarchaeia archaeon]